MRKILLAAVLACVPFFAQAQQYDSGWQIVDAKDLPDVEYSGAGIRVNNLIITQAEPPKGDRLGSYIFSASTVKRATGKRSARIELIGMKSDGKPSIVSVIAVNIYDEAPNKSSQDQHRFIAIPAEVNDTVRYMIRIVVP